MSDLPPGVGEDSIPGNSDWDERIDVLESLLWKTSFILRGMNLDPAIPDHAKEAIWNTIREIENELSEGEDEGRKY